MPPRWLTLAIVGFWLLAMVWLTVREIAPRWRLGEPPPYTIDLTDEVSGQKINWKILQRSERVGGAESAVRRLTDRTYELHSHIHCEGIMLFDLLDLTSTYHVNSEGE